MKFRHTSYLLALVWMTVPMVAWCAPDAPTGLQRDVVFDAAAPLARNGELLRRLVSPLQAQRIERELAGNSRALDASPLDPARQHFALYVPHGPPPPGGYALLVFVPPWNEARVPGEWIPSLDRAHTIFVTAAGSGNDADVFDRREPLALLAARNVMQGYRVDPAHVYIGGFSGGSRVALRQALGYPDLFRGALLDAGSDPVGSTRIPLPPAKLLHLFRQSSRIVFLTGDQDAVRQAQAARATASLQSWCMFNTASVTLLHTGHVLADAAGFARGLTALMRQVAPDMARIAACRTSHRRALAADLRRVQTLIGQDKFAQAATSLGQIDARYGGLAAPRSIELERAIDARGTPDR